MKGLTSIETVRELIREAVDPNKAAHLYNQALYLVGADAGCRIEATAGEELPLFPSLTLRQLEVGRSRQLLSDVHIVISRLLSSNVGFRVRGVRKEIEDVMRQFWRARVEGNGSADGGFLEELRAAGRDGNSLGAGFVQIGLVTDHESGYQKCSIDYVAPWYVLTCPHERNITRSPWVCFIKHYSVRDAVRMFGKKAKEHSTAVRDNTTQKTRTVVRVYEFFDLGLHGDSRPTSVKIVGSIGSDLFTREPNVFGCLPFAACLGWEAAVLGSNYGRVLHSLGSQEMLHRIERMMQAILEKGSIIDIVDPRVLEDADIALLDSGLPYVRVRKKQGVHGESKAVERIGAAEITQTMLSFLSMIKANLQSESNISEMDRGMTRSKRQTATEIDSQQASSEANRGFEAMQQALFLKRLIERVLMIAKRFDRTPFSVELHGQEVTMNAPEHPASWMDAVLDENYTIFLDTEALTAVDSRYQKAMDLAGLRELWPLVQAGKVSLEEFAERTLDILGESENFRLQQPQPQLPEGVNPVQGGQPRIEDVAREAARNSQAA